MASERKQIYQIPENFSLESRILGGAVKTRNFIEGVIMALMVVLPCLRLQGLTLNEKASLISFVGSIPLFIGSIGIMGDPVSIFLLNVFKWLFHARRYKKDLEPHPLKRSPLDEKEAAFDIKDLLRSYLDRRENRKKEKLMVLDSERVSSMMDEGIRSVTVSKEERGANIFEYLTKEEEKDEV